MYPVLTVRMCLGGAIQCVQQKAEKEKFRRDLGMTGILLSNRKTLITRWLGLKIALTITALTTLTISPRLTIYKEKNQETSSQPNKTVVVILPASSQMN